MRVLLISPTYPSESNPALGIYVQRIHDIYLELGCNTKLTIYLDLLQVALEKLFESSLRTCG
jgi:hypothetical protein